MPSPTARVAEPTTTGFPPSNISPPSAGREAEEHSASSVLPRAHEPREAEDFARADGEADIANAPMPGSKGACFENDPARLDCDLRKDGRQLAADHQADHFRAVHLRHRARADVAPVTEHGHAVGDLRQLLQPGAKYKSSPPHCPRSSRMTRKRFSTSRVAERRRRLIEDTARGQLPPQRPGNLDELLLRHRQLADEGLGRDVRADAAEQLHRPLPPLAPADEPQRPAGFDAQPDVSRQR